MALSGDFLTDPPRTVKPRKLPGNVHHPLIAVHLDSRTALIERTGDIVSTVDLPYLLITEPSSLWICPSSSSLLWHLDRELDGDPDWQFRCSPVKRDIITMANSVSGRRTRTHETIVNYFGFRNPSKKKGHWHYPIDPSCFITQTLADLLIPNPLAGLLEWGRDLRAWCAANQLHPSPTAGGLAGQLLRDPRFYPDARRKVPRATNARSRSALPGNHYDVRTTAWTATTGISLDMQSAHHNCAATLRFPSANGLLARGAFKDADTTLTTVPRTPPWSKNTSPAFPHILAGHGLFQLRVTIPKIHPDKFPPPYLTRPGQRLIWVFSNELPILHELGVIIDGIDACWTAYETDAGLNKYAAWALTELATMPPARRAWAKPTLLATYGILAAKPRVQEWGYKNGNGQARVYPAGNGFIDVKAHVGIMAQEIPTANVIHRGMIEAETRKQTLSLARLLTAKKVHVLAIYADAVIVEAGSQLPLLPHPWIVKGELTNLRFVASNAYQSDQEEKLPGIPRDDRERLRVLSDARKAGTIYHVNQQAQRKGQA